MNDTTAQKRAQADEALEALRAKLQGDVRPEPEPAPSLKDAGTLLKDLGAVIANLAGQGADKVEAFLDSTMEALADASDQGSLEPLLNLLKRQTEPEAPEDFDDLLKKSSVGSAYQIAFDSIEARDKFFAAMDNAYQEDADRADAYGNLNDDLENYEPNERVRQAVRRLKDIGLDFDADQMPERRFLDDDNLETWDRQPVPIPEPGPEQIAVGPAGPPNQWDDTALNQFWLVWSNKHGLWWMQDGKGYTEHVDSAGRYTYDEAVKIVNKSSNGWTANNTGVPHTTMLPDPF